MRLAGMRPNVNSRQRRINAVRSAVPACRYESRSFLTCVEKRATLIRYCRHGSGESRV